MRILLTGSTGFVGAALLHRWAAARELDLAISLRRPCADQLVRVSSFHVGDLEAATRWQCALDGVDTVVHTAARVHVMRDTASDPMAEFRRVNVEGTLNLGRQAAVAGVRRFIFISSIKVNGERTRPDQRFLADDVPAPHDPYGISKLEAELGLQLIARETGMEYVVIRPPLIYGPGVKANFLAMLRWVDRGIPLPFGRIDNRRSLVALDNLVDLVTLCLTHPAAANRVWLVSDNEDVSLSSLLNRMAHALGRSPRLVRVPQSWIEATAKMLGRGGLAGRLCDNLQVDIAKTQALLGWAPVVTVEQALEQVAATFNAGSSMTPR